MPVRADAAGEGMRIDGLREASHAFDRLAAAMPSVARKALRTGAAVVGEEIASRAPLLSGTMEGTIARSVHTENDGPLAVKVGPAHGLAPVFEFGGEITPKVKERLAFEGDEGLIRPRQVTIPARPFVRPAVDEARDKAVRASHNAASAELYKHVRRAGG